MTRRAEERTERAAHRLANVAFRVADALAYLDECQRVLDGFAERQANTGPSSSDTTSPTEAAAVAYMENEQALITLDFTIDQAVNIVARLDRLANLALRRRPDAPAIVPAPQPRCCDNQIGRQGVDTWGDPTCEDLPTKAALCSKCYQRERRWRIVHGLHAREIQPGVPRLDEPVPIDA